MTRANAEVASGAPARSLSAAIARFGTAHETLVRERLTLPDTPRERLIVLLREIDETVMSRRITLFEGDREIASLTVANRRLFTLDIKARVPALEERREPGDLAGHLLECAQVVTALSSQSACDHAPASDGESGISVQKLREELGFDAAGSDISHLSGLLEPISLARMTWSGDLAAHDFSGAESWRPLLEAHADRITRNISSQRTQKLSASPATTGMALPLSKDALLVVACKEDSGIAAIMPRQDGFKAISAWQITAQNTL